MEIRDKIQEEAFQAWNENGRRGIIKVAPRGGKTFIAKKAIPFYKRTFIVIPRRDIIEGWEDTLGKRSDILYCTTRGLKNLRGQGNILLILDEIHEYSKNQLEELEPLVLDPDVDVMALTGTLTKGKEQRLLEILGLPVLYDYSIEEAVKDGILTDYQINVHKVPLDNTLRTFKYKKGFITEKSYFDKIQYSVNKSSGVTRGFLEKKLIQVVQTSSSKLRATLSLLEAYKGQRVLVFCGQTKIADQLGIPVYHSKSKDKDILTKFCKDEGITQMACCMMLQAGITIRPIDRGILQYTSGSPENCAQKICRFLAYEWDKKARIDIICADESFELSRMRTALSYFDTLKINYI